MSVRAYFPDQQNDDTPEILFKRVFYPALSITHIWGDDLRLQGLSEYDREDGVSFACLRQAHNDLPYTLAGFREWLRVQPTFKSPYLLDMVADWDKEAFDMFRDFIRHGALNLLDASFCP